MFKQIPISFEFFPTKTDAGAENLKLYIKNYNC